MIFKAQNSWDNTVSNSFRLTIQISLCVIDDKDFKDRQ